MYFIIMVILLLALSIYAARKWPDFALLASPLVSWAVISCGVIIENNVGIVLGGAIFLVVLLEVAMFKADPQQPEWPHSAARRILIIVGIIISLTAFLISLALVFFWGLGVIILIILTWMLFSYALSAYQERTVYVVSTIGSSMRQNLPLATALAAAAAGRTDKRARTLRNISEWLAQGFPLSEAVQNGYPRCPGHIIAMIRVAERVDQLPLALKSLEADLVQKADKSRRISPIQPIYPIIIISFVFSVLSGITIFVIPKLGKIYGEFGISLPLSTRIVTTTFWELYLWFAGIISIILLVVVPLSIYVKFRPRRPGRPYLVSRIGDFLKWHMPLLHWFENNYSLQQAVETLRLALKAGGTVNGAIAQTLDLDVNYYFRKRLTRWLHMVERGEDIAAAARQSRLGGTLAWAFDQKVNKGNTMAILETLESFYRSNYSYRINLARYIMWPCTILLMASAVGFIIYSLFVPLVKMISSVSVVVYG